MVLLISAGEPHSHFTHPDYVPSVFPASYKKATRDSLSEARFEARYRRLLERRTSEQQVEDELRKREAEEREEKRQEEARVREEKLQAQRQKQEELKIQRAKEKEDRRFAKELAERQCVAEYQARCRALEAAEAMVELSVVEATKDQAVQTDGTLVSVVESLTKENAKLRERTFGVNTIQGNDSATKFYTGLPTWTVFVHLFAFLSPFVKQGRSLQLNDEFFLTLVKLRLNLMFVDLATRFGTSLGTASNIFQKWLNVMFVRLAFLITWPSREALKRNMPPAFKQLYPRCRVVIDCSEVFIEIPSAFTARSQTYSNYKKHNTIKFLIGITPCGTISFVSRCWGGRVSDKAITQESAFLNLLEPGDVVLADRGFTVSEDIAIHGARLEIPAFTRGKKQLSQKEVESSKELSSVRIHVERIIGLLKNRYTILAGPIQVNLLKHKDDIDFANIDKILVVCSALTNLGKPVVS